MPWDRETRYTSYQAEIDAVTAELGNVPVQQIRAAGVEWNCIEGVDPAEFDLRICNGVGFYVLLNATGTFWRDYGSCSRGLTKEYEEAQDKRDILIAGLPKVLAGMDEEGPIREVVPGLTGSPPIWGNVLRLTASSSP